MHTQSLLLVGSLLAGFGILAFTFRLKRDQPLYDKRDGAGLSWVDALVIVPVLISLLFVVLPMVVLEGPSGIELRFFTAACAVSIVLFAGYLPALLANYRLIGQKAGAPRRNAETLESVIVIVASAAALAVFVVIMAGIV